jgi:hypothetical protein
MVLQGYTDTARALASPTDDRRPYRDDDLPLNERNSSSEPSNYRERMMSIADKLQRTTISSYRRALDTYQSMSMLQRVLLVGAGILGLLVLILFLKFGENVFFWIAPLAKSLRDMRNGWMILWAFTFLVSFPPLIGYSSCVTIAGFVYGVRIGYVHPPIPRSTSSRKHSFPPLLTHPAAGSSSQPPPSSAPQPPSSPPAPSSQPGSPASSPTTAGSPPSP